MNLNFMTLTRESKKLFCFLTNNFTVMSKMEHQNFLNIKNSRKMLSEIIYFKMIKIDDL